MTKCSRKCTLAFSIEWIRTAEKGEGRAWGVGEILEDNSIFYDQVIQNPERLCGFGRGRWQCSIWDRLNVRLLCGAPSAWQFPVNTTHRRDMGPVWLLGSEDGEDVAHQVPSLSRLLRNRKKPRAPVVMEVTEKHIAKRAVAGFDAGMYSLAFSGAVASPGEEARKFPKVIQKTPSVAEATGL